MNGSHVHTIDDAEEKESTVSISLEENVEKFRAFLDKNALSRALPMITFQSDNKTRKQKKITGVSILPAGYIHNGALLIPFQREYWCCQASSEQERYARMNQ